ncbi:MAG TPA: hypothetical protein V6D20_24285 [Candidatus Obscuribacterales bacterium]
MLHAIHLEKFGVPQSVAVFHPLAIKESVAVVDQSPGRLCKDVQPVEGQVLLGRYDELRRNAHPLSWAAGKVLEGLGPGLHTGQGTGDKG